MPFLVAIFSVAAALGGALIFIFLKVFHDAEFMRNLHRPLEVVMAVLLLFLGPLSVWAGLYTRNQEKACSIWKSTWPASIFGGLLMVFYSVYLLVEHGR